MKKKVLTASLLVLCAVVTCTICGHTLSASTVRRQKLLSEILQALRILKVQLGTLLDPLEHALMQTKQGLFMIVAEGLPAAFSPRDAWIQAKTQACARGEQADCLGENDLAALDRLFDQLGSNGREGQMEAINSCILLLEGLYAEAKERSAQVGKVYTSLGFLSGLALALMMI